MAYVLVLTGGDCEDNPGHECVFDVIEVGSRQQARDVTGRLRAQGYHPHFMVTRPLSDYPELDERRV
jgi:hypothetical protein